MGMVTVIYETLMRMAEGGDGRAFRMSSYRYFDVQSWLTYELACVDALLSFYAAQVDHISKEAHGDTTQDTHFYTVQASWTYTIFCAVSGLGLRAQKLCQLDAVTSEVQSRVGPELMRKIRLIVELEQQWARCFGGRAWCQRRDAQMQANVKLPTDITVPVDVALEGSTKVRTSMKIQSDAAAGSKWPNLSGRARCCWQGCACSGMLYENHKMKVCKGCRQMTYCGTACQRR